MKRPRFPSHARLQPLPGDGGGEAVLLLTERRELRLSGAGLTGFCERVVPLLDGTRTIEEICASVGDAVPADAIRECLRLLDEHGLLEDGADEALPAGVRARLEPQLNFLREFGYDVAAAQDRLARATVTLFGLGGAAAAAALGLAAAGVGTLRCVDDQAVSAADAYLAPAAYAGATPGTPRVAALGERLRALNPEARVEGHAGTPASDEAVLALIEGSDTVVGCLDPGLVNLTYKLNRACLQAGIPWTSGTLSALEGIVGPTVRPRETACYLCYKMRAVACAEDPEDAFAYEQFLDRRRQDDSATRESLTFGAAIVGNMVGLEALKLLLGAPEPSALGRIVVVDFLHLTTARHTVLRKPWCPACYPADEAPAR